MTGLSPSIQQKSGIGSWMIALVAVVLSAILGLTMMRGGEYWPLYAALGAVAFVVILVRPEMTTLLILFVLYSNMAVIAKNNGVPEPIATGVFGVLALPLFQYVVVRRQRIIVNPMFVLMILYLGVLYVSAAASARASESEDRIFSYVVEGLVLYFLIINTLRTRELLRKAVWVLIFSGVVMGTLSLYQEITGDYDNDFGGWAQVKESEINVSGEDFFGQRERRPRLAGPIGSKNRYAQIMVVLLPLAVSQIVANRSLLVRAYSALACIPIVGGALLTFSRGAGIAIGVILLVFMLLRVFKLRTIALVALVVYITVIVFVPDYLYRITTVTSVASLLEGDEENADGAVLGRATVNLAAIEIFLSNPVLGVGPGQTAHYVRQIGNQFGLRLLASDRRAHNMYLEELADTGVVGFSVFMSIVGLTMWRLWRLSRAWKNVDSTVYYTLIGIFIAIIGYLVTAVFLHLSYVRYYWLLLAFAAAAIHVYSTVSSEQEEGTPALESAARNVATSRI